LEDASCTEVWLKVTGETGTKLFLTRNDIEVQKFTITSSPQTIRDDSLTPNTTYSYKITGNGQTSTTEATTLDTTSHDYTWETYTFGDYSSVLHDLAIVDESNIWAVGEIYFNDSTGQPEPTLHNAVHWNGNKWELKQVTVDFRGNMITPQLEGAFSFTESNFWFVGSLPLQGDGENWTMYDVRTTVHPNLSLSKAWGSSTDNIYFVGFKGSIAYYQSSQWSKLESGTDLPFQDIWGDNGEVLAIASDIFGFGGQYLINISGNTVNQISTDITTASAFSSVWFQSNRKYFLAGNGVYTKHNLLDAEWELDPISQPLETYFYSIRGSNLNNIVTVGEGSYIAHFNGVTWKVYNELRNPPDRLSSVAVTENMIVAVGNKYVNGIENYGLVYIGRR
jgi:hypothetical protein